MDEREPRFLSFFLLLIVLSLLGLRFNSLSGKEVFGPVKNLSSNNFGRPLKAMVVPVLSEVKSNSGNEIGEKLKEFVGESCYVCM